MQASGGGLDQRLEILGETAVAAEPSERALDHPTPWRNVEAGDAGRPLDGLERPLADLGQRGLEFGTGVAGIGEDMPQPGKGMADRGQ